MNIFFLISYLAVIKGNMYYIIRWMCLLRPFSNILKQMLELVLIPAHPIHNLKVHFGIILWRQKICKGFRPVHPDLTPCVYVTFSQK